MKIADVANGVTREEYLLLDKERGLISVFDREMLDEHGMNKLRRAYRITDPEGDEVKEIDLGKVVDEVIDAIKDNVDIKAFLRETLLNNFIEDTLKAHDLIKRHPQVAKRATMKPGCIELVLEDPTPGADEVAIRLRD